MKNNPDKKYSQITSFKDFHYERELLILRSKLIETRLTLNYLQVKKAFSVSSLFSSLAKEVVLPKISDFLGELIKKTEKEPQPVTEEKQEI